MSKFDLVADVSAYQPHHLGFFKKLKHNGVRAVIIKLTQGSQDGDAYVNPVFDAQLHNARKAGLRVHAYHYARFTSAVDAVNEARWFIQNLDRHKVSMKSAAVIDLEDPTIPKRSINSGTRKFLHYLRIHGYKKNDIYCMASWVWNRQVSPLLMRHHNAWIAKYGGTEPGVNHTGTWQFTDNYAGMHVDMSYDFKNFYTA